MSSCVKDLYDYDFYKKCYKCGKISFKSNFHKQNQQKTVCAHNVIISSFDILNENEMKKCFGWVNLRPMYVRENRSKGSKVDMWLYTLREIKNRYFLRNLNEQEERLN